MCPGRSASKIGNMPLGQLSTALYLKLLVSNSITVFKIVFFPIAVARIKYKNIISHTADSVSRGRVNEKCLQILVAKAKETRFLGIPWREVIPAEMPQFWKNVCVSL